MSSRCTNAFVVKVRNCSMLTVTRTPAQLSPCPSIGLFCCHKRRYEGAMHLSRAASAPRADDARAATPAPPSVPADSIGTLSRFAPMVTLPAAPDWWIDQFDDGQTVSRLAARFSTNPMRVYRHLHRIGVPLPSARSMQQWLTASTTPDGGCLRWTGRFAHGVPIGRFGGSEPTPVRRIIWVHTRGPVPDGHWIVRSGLRSPRLSRCFTPPGCDNSNPDRGES